MTDEMTQALEAGATIKESELNTVENAAKFRALDANGNSVNVTDATAVKLLAAASANDNDGDSVWMIKNGIPVKMSASEFMQKRLTELATKSKSNGLLIFDGTNWGYMTNQAYATVVGELLDENSTLKQRGTINLSEDVNLAKYIQNNIAKMKNGVYSVIGTSTSTSITDWGTLMKISSNSLLFHSLNRKNPVFFFYNPSGLSYMVCTGDTTNGPF